MELVTGQLVTWGVMTPSSLSHQAEQGQWGPEGRWPRPRPSSTHITHTELGLGAQL